MPIDDLLSTGNVENSRAYYASKTSKRLGASAVPKIIALGSAQKFDQSLWRLRMSLDRKSRLTPTLPVREIRNALLLKLIRGTTKRRVATDAYSAPTPDLPRGQ